MAIQTQTVLDQIEVTRESTLQLRFALEIVNDGIVLSSKWHRTLIPQNGDIAGQIAAVDEGLATLGFPPVRNQDVERVTAVAGSVWG